MTVRVLFLCTGNSARSQIAEALVRAMTGGKVESYSAGTNPRPLHSLAVAAMRESGIDISAQRSKSYDRYVPERFDYVISVCARAAEDCPSWPKSRERIKWSIEDPAAVEGDDGQKMQAFRRACTDLRQRIGLFLLANHLVTEVRPA